MKMKSKTVYFNYADFKLKKIFHLHFQGQKKAHNPQKYPQLKFVQKLMCRLHDSGEFIPIRLDIELSENYLDTIQRLWLPVLDTGG